MTDAVRRPRASTPFFRRSHSGSSSESDPSSSINLSDSDSDQSAHADDYDDDDDDYCSSSSSLGLLSFRFERTTGCTNTPHSGPLPLALPLSSPSTSTAFRSSLKLSLAYLRARQSLAAHSFESLAQALRTLAPLVATPDRRLGVFVPILERFSRDLAKQLTTATREYRRDTLNRDDAKALVALRQKHSRSVTNNNNNTGSTRDRKDTDFDWIRHVQREVDSNPRPGWIDDSTETTALLDAIESVLLPSCSIPRVSLANVGLDSRRLASWPALEHLETVIEWYLSFSTDDDDPASGTSPSSTRPSDRARTLIGKIKSLDLSRNRLDTFPDWLPTLFRSIDTLSLSHNEFKHLPPSITLFSNLTRLRTHGNHLVAPESALLPLEADEEDNGGKDRRRRKKRASDRSGRGTRANSKRLAHSLFCCERPRTQSWMTETSRLSLAASSDGDKEGVVRSLFRTSIELVLASDATSSSLLPFGEEDDETTVALSPCCPPPPPQLLETLSRSYTCASCRRWILFGVAEDADLFVAEPVYERVHFVSPGISLPDSLIPLRRDDEDDRNERHDRLGNDDHVAIAASTDHDEVDHDERESRRGIPADLTTTVEGGGGGTVRRRRRGERPPEDELASFEQLLLLTVYNRYDAQPPPPPPPIRRRQQQRESTNRPRRPRRTGLPTIVIGGGGDRTDDRRPWQRAGQTAWRFCRECLPSHLGIPEPSTTTTARECECFVCVEERRVRQGRGRDGQGQGHERVLRWLRRRERVKGEEQPRRGEASGAT